MDESTSAFNHDEAAPSAVLENYLEVIFTLQMRDGAARASAIAEEARVSRSTVTSALKTLKAMELVQYEPYSLIHLTPRGLAIGRDIAHRHLVFQEFFQQVLQLDPQKADEIACAMEHVAPPEAIQRLGQFVLFLKTRPAFWENWLQIDADENIAAEHVPRSLRPTPEPESESPYK